MELSLDSVPGLTPDRQMVLVESGMSAGVAVAGTLAAALAAKVVGAGAARTFLGLALLGYGLLRADDKPMLAVGLGAIGAKTLIDVLLAGVASRVMPAGALPSGAARTVASLPYHQVVGWA